LVQPKIRKALSFLAVIAISVHASSVSADDKTDVGTPEPLRIDSALPDWISITAKHRTRYEFLDDEFRAGTQGDREILVLRTLLHTRLKLFDGLWLGAEVQDSRAEINGDTPLNTGIVNTTELLRAYLEFKHHNVLGGKVAAQAGRLTLDVGSRRFVSRNRYRNTINGFTGIDFDWKSKSGTEFRAFWTLPVRRQPTRFDQLRDNKVQDDEEDFDLQFWGVYAATNFTEVDRGEVFFFGLHEKDEPSRLTRKRDLYTPGFRVFRKPASDKFDYTIETAFQVGRSRTSTTGRRVDHLAHFHHFEIGYTFDIPWAPRLVAEYDFASGDSNPTDGDNNQFDTLFGARRFDFGPTGIYGPFARNNLNTPGVRLQLKPAQTVSTFFGVRTFWLADRSDTWASSGGVRDTAGKSGRYLGSQFEARVRWDVLPGNVRLESGYAHLLTGAFVEDAPNSNRPGDLNYFYLQATISL